MLALAAAPARSDPARSAVTVSQASHRLLGVRAGWELLGYGPGRTVRVQFARGRVTRTVLPGLDSNGPVWFVAGPSQMIIRPWDFVPGYVVPDGKPAQPLTGVLSRGGEVLPGPRPGEVRVQSTYPIKSLSLARVDGSVTGVSLRLPAGGWWLASPERAGRRAADRRRRDLRRLAGRLPAHRRDARGGRPDPLAGRDLQPPAPLRGCGHQPAHRRAAAGWAARRSRRSRLPLPESSRRTAPRPRCSGSRRAARSRCTWSAWPPGRISGSPVPLGPDSLAPGKLAWSPDSRWLFVVTAHGGLAAVNAGTRSVEGLGVRLPWLSQIAVRNASG